MISLDNVAIDDSANAASAVLTALDGGSLHGGQIYRLASSGVSIGNQDSRYTSIDGKAIIPALVQNEFLRYNVTMLQTKFTPEQEFTVIELTTSTFSDGAAVEIVFNQGPKGDAGSAGTQGATGATGLKGDAGLTGLTGPQGTVGATGAAGSQGSTGSTGSAGTNGTNGTNGYSVLSGASVASGGVNGDFYIDTAANTISGPKAGENWPTVVSLIGPTGATGATGPQGTVGATGATGAAGTQGATGATGLKGDAGLTGLTGPQGTVGATGAAGSQGSTGSTGSAGTNGTNGTNGYSVLSGAGVASGGVNGDFYIDTVANTISGPKASENWPTVVSLIGPTGPQGTGAPVHAIGEQYAGGRVFWVDASGQHGLIAALADQSTAVTWRNAVDKVTGTSGDGLYAGAMNTAMIVSAQIADNQAGSFAALVAANYSILADGITPCTGDASESCYGDWYLPSKAELNLLYNQGGFAVGSYWSSTESGAGNAWLQHFNGGSQGIDIKSYSLRVRAVRAF